MNLARNSKISLLIFASRDCIYITGETLQRQLMEFLCTELERARTDGRDAKVIEILKRNWKRNRRVMQQSNKLWTN